MLKGADRRRATLEDAAQRAARESLTAAIDAPARVAKLLRPRELTILALYSEGLSAVEIADIFVISPHTVRTHVKNAYRRLGIHSREEAARLIHTERVLELPSSRAGGLPRAGRARRSGSRPRSAPSCGGCT